MVEENPYAVSAECMGKGESDTSTNDPYSFQVVGNAVVCGSEVILPSICPLTRDTEDLVPASVTAEYAIFSLVIRQRSCRVIYWLSRQTRRKQRWTKAGFLVLFWIGIASMFVGTPLESPGVPLATVLGIICIFASVVGLRRTGIRLHVARYKAPNTYWISGFPKAYVALLAHCDSLISSAQESKPFAKRPENVAQFDDENG